MKAAEKTSLFMSSLFTSLKLGNLEKFSQLLAYFRGKKHAAGVITFLDL